LQPNLQPSEQEQHEELGGEAKKQKTQEDSKNNLLSDQNSQ